MGEDKLWIDLGGRPLLAWTLDGVEETGAFAQVVIAAPRTSWARIEALLAATRLRAVLVEGGRRRQDSVRAALDAVDGACGLVCVHDAARPLCPPALFLAVLVAAQRYGAATAAIPLVDSIKRVDTAGIVVESLDRAGLVAVQTPQAFTHPLLRRAHDQALRLGRGGDDDAVLVEQLGEAVHVVPGARVNLKVTVAEDAASARAMLRSRVGSAGDAG